MFKGDLEGDLEVDLEWDSTGEFRGDWPGPGSGLVQITILELDTEVCLPLIKEEGKESLNIIILNGFDEILSVKCSSRTDKQYNFIQPDIKATDFITADIMN